MVTTCWRINGIMTTFHIGFNNMWIIYAPLLWCISTHIHLSVFSPWINTCACPQEEPHPHILVESTPHPKAQWRDSEQGGVVHPNADYEDSRNQNAILHCKCWDMMMQHHKKFPQLAMALQNHARIDWLRTIISHTHAPLLCIVAPYIVMNSVIASVGNVTIQSSSAWVWLIMSDTLMYTVVFTHVQFGWFQSFFMIPCRSSGLILSSTY